MPENEQPIKSSVGERPGETPEPAVAPDVAELQEQLAQARAQAMDYKDQWLRATAEMSNARKRMQREGLIAAPRAASR